MFGIFSFSRFFAQTSYITNYSPASSIVICKDNYREIENMHFDANQGFVCSNGISTLYYSIHALTSETVNGGPNTFSYDVSHSGNLTTSSYTIFGPFNYGDDYETSIATHSAPILSSGETGIGERYLGGNFTANKFYILEIKIPSCSGEVNIHPYGNNGTFDCKTLPQKYCENCIPQFQPANGKYVVSAWIKEANNLSALTYQNSILKVISGSNVATFQGTGQIIDGWQRIEGVFQTDDLGNIQIELSTTVAEAYFDDIRIFPLDGSMVTYVYDPLTLRLAAELDERNYAKLYEYDEEGKLIRVKKETEKGVMTIQENRENVKGN